MSEAEERREAEQGRRLEELWAGPFGDAYAERNAAADRGRRDFWEGLHRRLGFESALEVGCNVGGNLRWLAELLGPERAAGVDVNESALRRARERIPGVDVRRAGGRELPFPDASFDLVFTTGVLIHVPPDDLHGVMAEIVRCARRYVLCGEYFAPDEVEVPYRGERGALFKRDYGRAYQEAFPELTLLEQGFLARGEATWDDVTFWVFELG